MLSTRIRHITAIFVALAIGSAGCAANKDRDTEAGTAGSDDSETGTSPDGDSATATETETNGEIDSHDQVGCGEMDILLVVEKGAESLSHLVHDMLPVFVQRLDEYAASHGRLDYRIGVTSTDVSHGNIVRYFPKPGSCDGGTDWDLSMKPYQQQGDDGILAAPESCSFGDDPWVSKSASLSEDVFCAIYSWYQPYERDAMIEMPFEATRLALGLDAQGALGAPNHGFYRKNEDSLLVVVFVTKEDDCSLAADGGTVVPDGLYCDPDDTTPKYWTDCGGAGTLGLLAPAEMQAFLDDLSGGADRYVVAALVEDPAEKACLSDDANGAQVTRIKQLIASLGDHGALVDLCGDDLVAPWIATADAATKACASFPEK